jgi:hypothetical protein
MLELSPSSTRLHEKTKIIAAAQSDRSSVMSGKKEIKDKLNLTGDFNKDLRDFQSLQRLDHENF